MLGSEYIQTLWESTVLTYKAIKPIQATMKNSTDAHSCKTKKDAQRKALLVDITGTQCYVLFHGFQW